MLLGVVCAGARTAAEAVGRAYPFCTPWLRNALLRPSFVPPPPPPPPPPSLPLVSFSLISSSVFVLRLVLFFCLPKLLFAFGVVVASATTFVTTNKIVLHIKLSSWFASHCPCCVEMSAGAGEDADHAYTSDAPDGAAVQAQELRQRRRRDADLADAVAGKTVEELQTELTNKRAMIADMQKWNRRLNVALVVVIIPMSFLISALSPFAGGVGCGC